jgi:MscS family membrane protein
MLAVAAPDAQAAAPTGSAQSGQAPAAPPVPVAPDSPRESLQRFLDLCRATHFDEAADYLDLSEAEKGRGAELARRLKSVVDHYVWFDMTRISGRPDGAQNDGLEPNVDQLGTIPTPEGAQPLRMRREGQGDSAKWVFTRGTVERVDGWFSQLGDAWVIDHLPAVLLRPGPRELQWWQWIGLFVIAAGAWLAGLLLGAITKRILQRVTTKTTTHWDDAVIGRLTGPLGLVWSLCVAGLAVPFLGLYAPAQAFIDQLLHTGFFIAFFWAILRTIEVVAQLVATSRWSTDHPSSRSLVPLGSRVGKVAVWAMGIIAVLSELGYPVASLIAGLGIGGLVFALAGQKTVENLFGAFSIGIDQPFREGDFVHIEDFVGTVERIGLRSTRIRTLDRTIITIPNGKLADMRLESFAERDRIRLALTVGVVFETTAQQMREVLAGLERVLRTQAKIWPDSVTVKFSGFGDASLNIDIMAWFMTPDWGEFMVIRENVLIDFMAVVEKAGTALARPTRTLHLSPETAKLAETVAKAG